MSEKSSRKKERPGMSSWRIYFKGFKFILYRMLWTILAAFAFLAVITPGIIATFKESPAAEPVTVFCVAIGLMVFQLIRKRTAKLNRASFIALIARGTVEKSLPGDVCDQCSATVKRYYEKRSLPKSILAGLKAFLDSARKKAEPGEVAEALAGIGVSVSFMLSGLIPYIGPCTLAWTFTHEDRTLLRNKCDAYEIVFKNKLRSFLIVIGTLFIEALLTFVIALIMGVLFYLPVMNSGGLVSTWDSAVTAAGYSQYTYSELYVQIATVVTLFICWLLVEPFCLIRLIRRFLKTGNTNPPSGRVYELTSARLSRIFRDKPAEDTEEQPEDSPTD